MVSSDRHTAWGWAAMVIFHNRGSSIWVWGSSSVPEKQLSPVEEPKVTGISIFEFWVRPWATWSGFAGSQRCLKDRGKYWFQPKPSCDSLFSWCIVFLVTNKSVPTELKVTFKIILSLYVNLGKVNKLVITVYPKAICLWGWVYAKTTFQHSCRLRKIGVSAEFDNIQWTVFR